MKLPRSTTFAALAVLLVACGGGPTVELDVAPAGATDEAAEPVAPTEPETADTDGDQDPADAPAEPGDDADQSSAEPRVTTPPAGGTSAEPSPLPADPELVVGDDGCVTDVATGLVVTCHDPAAGPDDS